VQPTGKGVGDAVTRAVARKKAAAGGAANTGTIKTLDRNARIEAAMHRPWDRARRGNTLWIWLGILLVAGAFIYAAPDVAKIFTPAWNEIVNAERDRAIWPPHFGSRSWGDVLDAVVTTMQIAFAATLMATIISAVVGPLSARNVAPNSWIRNTFRGIALTIRAIPDLVIAILFIIAAGIGPQAGALALGIGGVGLLAKLIGDSMEEVPNGPERALSAGGSTRTQVFFSSTMPMSVPAMVSHLMYLLEQNIRSATLLGIVGAGGIGFLLLNALQGRHFDEVLAYVLVIIAMVVLVESASILIRRALK